MFHISGCFLLARLYLIASFVVLQLLFQSALSIGPGRDFVTKRNRAEVQIGRISAGEAHDVVWGPWSAVAHPVTGYSRQQPWGSLSQTDRIDRRDTSNFTRSLPAQLFPMTWLCDNLQVCSQARCCIHARRSGFCVPDIYQSQSSVNEAIWTFPHYSFQTKC